jgi:N-acetylglucosaminyldiphosphoundecaprenol N-acetyl-beta-D-mannosaminyltransferase
MYLRYGDPSWDAAEDSSDPTPPSPRRNTGGGEGGGGPNGQAPNAQGGSNGNGSQRKLPVRAFPSVHLAGVRLDAITEEQCIKHLLDAVDAGRGGMLVTPNLDHLHRCSTNLAFSAMVAEADLVVADGMPLVWASRLQGTPLPERVAGSNLITTLSGAAAERGRSIYLLGGSEGTADGAARVLTEKFPSLKVAGTWYPPVGFEDDAAHMAELVSNLDAAKPDIVYVALGSPKQERLIARLRPILPGAWWLGVGNSFSFLCGDVRRAPRWMQISGLEWMHRLFQEPKRLFKRYVMVGLPFAATLLTRSAVKGVPNRLFKRNKRHGFDLVIPHAVAEQFEATLAPVAPPPSAGPTPSSRETVMSDEPAAPFIDVEPRAGSATSLSRLRALVLLGGAVRPSPLAQTSDRSVLDLPLDDRGTVLSHWVHSAAELAKSAGLESLTVRVMVNQSTPEPTSAAKHYGALRVERDASDFRGTGGVLRDLAVDYGDDDLILVANAAQILLDPLPTIVAAMTRKAGDVAVISHADGTPSGLMLVTCKVLRSIADTGYIDMKEQALPQIALNHEVRVVQRRRPTGLPIRTLEDYVQALRLHHRRRQGKPFIPDPLAEDWSPSFALIEPGANVDPSARVHDSIVLEGGIVEAGAVLVRSLVCADEVVRRDKTVVDQAVTTEEARRRRAQHGFDVLTKTAAAAM